jgi:hypothetical protein
MTVDHKNGRPTADNTHTSSLPSRNDHSASSRGPKNNAEELGSAVGLVAEAVAAEVVQGHSSQENKL